LDLVLLDTTVASILHPDKGNDQLRSAYSDLLGSRVGALSFQTVAEMWYWAEKQEFSDRRKSRLEAYIYEYVLIDFDKEMIRLWATVRAESDRFGRRLSEGDSWIAATAIYAGLQLLTHDGDFVGLNISGLEVMSLLRG